MSETKDKVETEENSLQIAVENEIKGVNSFDGVGAAIAGLQWISSIFEMVGVPVRFILGFLGLWKFSRDHNSSNFIKQELEKLNEDIKNYATKTDKIEKDTIPQRAHIIHNALDAMVKNVDPGKFAYYRKVIVGSLQPEFNDINMEHAWKIARALEQLSPGELRDFCSFMKMEMSNALISSYIADGCLVSYGLIEDSSYGKYRSVNTSPYISTEAGKKLYFLIKSDTAEAANDAI